MGMMMVMASIIIGLVALDISIQKSVKSKKNAQKNGKVSAKQENRHEAVKIATPLELRPWLINVTPLPMKVIDFSHENVDLRLVMRGGKEIKRFAMLWKMVRGGGVEKFKLIKLNSMTQVDMDKAVSLSITEAKEIADKVFGKKKDKEKKKPEATEAAPVVAKPPVTPEIQGNVVVPFKAEPASIKGFKSNVTGVLIKAGIEPHVTTRNGEAEEYKTYTATIDVNGERVVMKGNDIRRALADASASPGNKINLVHVRDEALPDKKTRKVYACSVVG